MNVGEHIRDWRKRRRLSQLDLALGAEISMRHLSFLETGRANPSRAMLLKLADELEIPLRERNVLLVSAGFAPVFRERGIDDPALAPARRALDAILQGHEPFPALVVDRGWNLVAANAAVPLLLEGVAPELLHPPLNVLRVALHPDGVARHSLNAAEWGAHIMERLRRQVAMSGEDDLRALLAELEAYPQPPADDRRHEDFGGVAVQLRLARGDRILSFFTTTTVFGAALDITLSELTLETFFPADAETREALAAAAEAR